MENDSQRSRRGCTQVCKPVCQRVTTITTTQQISGGKGMPVMSGKGKWGKKL